MTSNIQHIFPALLMSLFVGCGGGPVLAPVSGTVMYQGSPLANATVTFIPKGEGAVGTAVTLEDGTYQIQTAGQEGVAPGLCAVTVSKMEQGSNQATLDQMSDAERQKMMMSGQTQKSMTAPKSALPAQYGSQATSGLSFDVTLDGPNDFLIELK